MLPFVVFTGRAQSGKTTCANLLVERGYTKLSFADPLKRMLQALTIVTDKKATPSVLCGKTVREALQTLGTEWGRKLIGENIWVEYTAEKVRQLILDYENGTGKGIVIDDCRFDNEASAMRCLGATIVGVSREQEEVMLHESEKGVSSYLTDYVILNNGPMEVLEREVSDMLEEAGLA